MLRVFVQKNIFELSKLSGRISWKSLVGLWIFAQWWNQWVTRKFFFSFTILLFLLSLFLTWVCIYFIDWIRSKVYLLLYAGLFTPYLFTFILLFNSLQITVWKSGRARLNVKSFIFKLDHQVQCLEHNDYKTKVTFGLVSFS